MSTIITFSDDRVRVLEHGRVELHPGGVLQVTAQDTNHRTVRTLYSPGFWCTVETRDEVPGDELDRIAVVDDAVLPASARVTTRRSR